MEVRHLIGSVDIPHGSDVFVVSDFSARVAGITPALVAGDDAAEARWVTYTELAGLPTSPGLVETLKKWGIWS